MKLYAHPFSNNSMRAQLCLDEKGLDYEYVMVDLFKGEHKQPAFLAINPRGQVPALVDGDVRIYESVAIVEYLEYRYPEPSLTPGDPAKMATCLRLIAEFNQKLDPTNIFGSVKFRGSRRADLGDRVDKLLSECRVWEEYLGDGPFSSGKSFRSRTSSYCRSSAPSSTGSDYRRARLPGCTPGTNAARRGQPSPGSPGSKPLRPRRQTRSSVS